MGILSKRKVLANGKIVIVDFKKLNPMDFTLYKSMTAKSIKNQSVLASSNGVIYINSKMEGHEVIAEMFAILMAESKATLQQYYNLHKPKFADYTWDNFGKYNGGKEERGMLVILLSIPVELKRRELERNYYS